MATSAVHLTTEEFCQEFLSHPSDYPTPGAGFNPFSALQHANKNSGNNVAELIIAAVNSHLAPGSTASAYGYLPECSTDKATQKTRSALFRTHSIPTKGHPLWADQIVPIHIQAHRRGIDPFENAEQQDEYGELRQARKRVFESISAVADVLFAAQQRVFLFTLLFIGRKFRLLRWDRAGVVTTPATDYYEHPHLLCDILWRIGQMDDDALGFDPSATRVLPGDIDFTRMDFAGLRTDTDLSYEERRLEESEIGPHPVFEYVRSLFRTSLSDDWPRYKLQVSDGKIERAYLVGKPTFRAPDVFGRGTRGYVAYECETGRFVWLKDVWRASYMITETEGQVLRKLNAAGVENVPTLICEGDVRDQATITADWWKRARAHASASLHVYPSSPPSSSSATLVGTTSPTTKKRKMAVEPERASTTSKHRNPRRRGTLSSDCPLRQHSHYRIVVEEVCMALKNFKYGGQLVALVLDCLLAHRQAATHPETRILHCDISGGNILIYPKIKRDREGKDPALIWTGILTDWELSKSVDAQEAASKATQVDRMGTLQFMSVNLLTHINKPVTIADELESFFHVLVYYAVSNLRSNCTGIASWIDNFFHNYAGPERMLTCGPKSVIMEMTGSLETRSPPGPLLFYSPMDNVLAPILTSLRAHYKVMAYERAKAAPRRTRPRTPPPPPPDPAPPRLLPEIDESKYNPEDLARWKASLKAGIVDDFTPTPEDRELAANLVDHKFMLNHLSDALGSRYWQGDDRIPTTKDSEPASCCVSGSPFEAAAPRDAKRQRMSEPERNVSLPARLHPSTRRTQIRTRTHPLRARR
ncbi:hypothetical protein DICSQDRAFT_181971 [Dichomitus squalens LYAD-421 SS1]|uniref:Protein kinase domain-containing protein n=2 Tax=Dichomitus squalens TaxID=114155 RepID=A0A4Q9MCZ0_9APHY|nr:uncharacterized protein DICSQDRAFT_181971 [Dichomitus squalens LYAD-421 SS1]EJF59475.1 hypothetical protein DICSQDRAFT_181971 [Dichomitus squalens LYAD-421 SS1]TBU23676.1 hypothetical protein BD311DRAFT_66658 [Dichomitus squalens]